MKVVITEQQNKIKRKGKISTQLRQQCVSDKLNDRERERLEGGEKETGQIV